MPTRRIGDVQERDFCNHPDHSPPNMVVYEPGVYEHECPRCGRKLQWTVYPTAMLEEGDRL